MTTHLLGLRVIVPLLVLSMVSCDIWDVEKSLNPRYCDGLLRRCQNPALPICDVPARECVAFSRDGGGDGPMCHEHTDCLVAAPICDQSGICRGCAGNADDAACGTRLSTTPRCKASGTNAGTCVACAQNTDCTTPAVPICGDDGACRKCGSNSECASGACKGDGSCASPSEVAYVDNGGKSPALCKMSGMHDGNSAQTAYCDVQDAVLDSAKRAYAVVMGSVAPYGPVSIMDRTLTLIGPGPAGSKATIRAQAGPAVLVTGSSTVIVDGCEMLGASVMNDGVSCLKSGPAVSLTVLRSSIHDNNGAGISSTGCTITLDANQISANQGGGVNLASTTYAITNNIIAGNGSLSASIAGVAMTAGASGTFAFNTVAKNHVAAGPGGIDCGNGTTKAILNSIVWGNDLDTGSQLSPKCMLLSVVTGKADMKGTMLDPSFVGPTDFHLKPNDPANAGSGGCCVDKVLDAAMLPNSNHDVDGTKRPKGMAWDIGAHEVE